MIFPRIILSVAFCLVITVFGYAAERINVFQSGDFEKSNLHWRPICSDGVRGQVVYDSSCVAAGKYSLRITNPGGGNVRAYSDNSVLLDQTTPEPIDIAFWAKRDKNNKARTAVILRLVYQDGSKENWYEHTTLKPELAGRWCRMVARFRPNKPVRSFEIWPIVNGDKCIFWIDDIKIITTVKRPDVMPFVKNCISIKNEKLQIELGISPDKKKLGISGIISPDKKINFIGSWSNSVLNLWAVKFLSPDNKILTLDSGKLSEVKKNDTAEVKELKLKWRQVPVPGTSAHADITVTIRIPGNSTESQSYIDINTDKYLRIYDVAFPQIKNLGPIGLTPEDDFLAIPYHSGELIKHPSKNLGGRHLDYAAKTSMQFFAFYDSTCGLYLASHDGMMHAKDFSVRSSLNGSLQYAVSTVPEGSIKKRNSWQQAFPFIIGVFEGDWFDAAKRYRKWAIKQTWCERGRLIDRKDGSPLLNSIEVWAKGGGLGQWYQYAQKDMKYLAKLSPKQLFEQGGYVDPTRSSQDIIATKKSLGDVGVGCWFTDNWHCGGVLGIDGLGPEYIARKGFAETVENFNNAGIPVMPYTNIQRWCTDLPDYKASRMIQSYRHQPRTAPEHGGQVGIMCPGDKDVISCWESIVKRICKLKCNGLYLDELSTNGNPVCYSDAHEHKPGDGTARLRSQRNLADTIRTAARKDNPNFFTMGEQGSETYIGVNDICLWWYASRGDLDIPMFEAVYHDYAICMGRVPGKWYGPHCERGYSNTSGDADLEELAVNLGKCFVHGNQLGVIRHDFFRYSREGTKMLKKMAEIRQRAKKYMHFGQMLRPPLILQPQNTVIVPQSFLGFMPTKSVPVLSSCFKADDGSIAVVFFNITNKEQKIVWETFPTKDWGFKDGNYEIVKISDSGKSAIEVVKISAGEPLKYENSIQPYSPLVLSFSPTKKDVSSNNDNVQKNQDAEKNVEIQSSCNPIRIKAGDELKISGKITNLSKKIPFESSLELIAPDRWQIKPGRDFFLAVSPDSSDKFQFSLKTSAEDINCPKKIELKVKALNYLQKWNIKIAEARKTAYVRKSDDKDLLDASAAAWEKADMVALVPPRRGRIKFKDIKVTAKFLYSAKGLYIRAEVIGDSTPTQPSPDKDIWKGDCIQLAFNGSRLGDSYDLSLGIALVNNQPVVYDFLASALFNNLTTRISNTDIKKIYILMIPWKLLGFQQPPTGKHIGFNMTYNENDGDNFNGWLEWTPGICGGKLPNEFGDLIID